jgi:riboflavin synthase
MFTGIVEAMGLIVTCQPEDSGSVLVIESSMIVEDLHLGDSVSVDGVCLTVTTIEQESFTVGVSPETLRRSNLGDLREQSRVNLERAVLAGGRMGGHYVQGHVDGIGMITERSDDGTALRLVMSAHTALLPYIVEKGFVAVDGISLTVTGRGTDWFSVMLVPYTQQAVTLGSKEAGATVNLEVDVVAKYVESLLEGRFDRRN